MAAMETEGPSGAIRSLTSVYFNATVCVLVCVGGLGRGHEGVRLLIFPLAVLGPCIFFSRRRISPSFRKSQTQSVHPDVDRCAALSGTTSAATQNKRRKHAGGRATLGLSCSPPLETAFLGSHETLGKHRRPSKKRSRPLAEDLRAAADVI